VDSPNLKGVAERWQNGASTWQSCRRRSRSKLFAESRRWQSYRPDLTCTRTSSRIGRSGLARVWWASSNRRQGSVDGQYLHREALAVAEVRECISLRNDNRLSSARGHGTWIKRFDDERPHFLLDDRTPTEVYFNPEFGSFLGSCPEMTRRNRAA